MKRVVALLALLVASAAYGDELADRLAAVPNPRQLDGGWVSDPVNVVANRRADINRLIDGLEKSASAEIAVVVLPTIGDLVPKNFATALIEKWGVGKKSKDNGVLVLHVLDQRRIEIETGYGLEGSLPDVKCHWITEEIAVPFFRQNSFADGHYEVVRALIRAIEQPDIKHADLIAPLETQPGRTIDELPNIPAHDDIALKYSPVPVRALYSAAMPFVLLALGGICFWLATAAYRKRSKGKDPYARYQAFKSGAVRWQYLSTVPLAAAAFAFEYARTATFFSPVPIFLASLFGLLWQRSKFLKALREEPRTCQCGKQMRRLDEREDDAYLERGKAVEEAIGSMDYDVWMCDCGKSRIESYQGKTAAEPCAECGYRTYRVISSRVLQAATTVSTGLRELVCNCANCSYTKTDTFTIPMVSTSTNSSGGSSGRSSGSFGGGRSGGGGAGSSY